MAAPPLPTPAHPEIGAGDPKEARARGHDLNVNLRRWRRFSHDDFSRFSHYCGWGVPVSHFFAHDAPGHQQ
jgi:hypothetical protein